MAIIELRSQRLKAAALAGKPDVYTYDALPDSLRAQVVHIWNDLIGRPHLHDHSATEDWAELYRVFIREKGVFALRQSGSPYEQWISYFMGCSTDDALDMIELSFRVMDNILARRALRFELVDGTVNPKQAIEELNHRFREHGLGYDFTNGELVRIDSQYLHSEAVRPALALLSDPGFEKANDEFIAAHRHYREGRHKDAVVAANRCFEATLKAICTAKKWTFNSGDRASELIKVVRANGLFPDYLDSGFDTYIAVMKTGLPGVRNSAGGHGDGPAAPEVPEYIARYALHLTAANILLLVDAAHTQ